ncbi:MAG: peptide ABC transporter substrate-binding protein [Acutalibacteraceae bacterium]
MRKRLISVLLMISLISWLMLSTACNNSQSDPSSERIYYNLDDEPVTLDPQIADDDSSRLVIMNIFEGLTRLDENDDPVAGAAESWEKSEDEKTYTFHLRDGISWYDGTPVTAQDFVFGMQRTVDKNTSSSTAKTLFSIKNAEKINKGKLEVSELGVTAPDDKTVVIELEYRNEELLKLLATPPTMPCSQTFFETTRGQYGREPEMLLSNGPFRLREDYGWTHNSELYIRRNAYYSGTRKAVPFGVDFTIGESYDDIALEIASGSLDAGAVPGKNISSAEENGLNITTYSDTVVALCLNLNSDIFQNKNIRLAFLTSFNRDDLLAQLPAHAVAANDLIGEYAQLDGESYRELAGGDFYLKQSKKARTYMEQGLKELGLSSIPAVSVLCSDDEEVQTIVTNLLQSWNENMGYYFNKNPVSKSDLEYYVSASMYDIALVPISSKGITPLDFLSAFKSTSDANIINLNSSAYNKSIAAIEKSPGKESLKTYIKLEKYLNDQAVLYPVYFESRYFASAANVTGIVFHEYNGGVDFTGATKLSGNN